MKTRTILLTSLLATAIGAQAQVQINVDAAHPGIHVSPTLYGIFYEDINHAADGGLYAELIRNRSFEESRQLDHYRQCNSLISHERSAQCGTATCP